MIALGQMHRFRRSMSLSLMEVLALPCQTVVILGFALIVQVTCGSLILAWGEV